MNDFEYDCLQRKRLAGQAKYRKRGSRSKKCSLPSDRMTEKQWKERCGPVVSFNFNRPMSWDNFKKLTTIVQTEYIRNLQKKYGVTAVDLGDMFGVQALTVRKYVEKNKLEVTFPRGRGLHASHKEEWNRFLGITSQPPEEDVVETPAYENATEEPSEEQIGVGSTTDTIATEYIHNCTGPNVMSMRRFSLQFSGAIDVNMIANSLRLILGEQSNGELEIVCSLA